MKVLRFFLGLGGFRFLRGGRVFLFFFFGARWLYQVGKLGGSLVCFSVTKKS